MAQVADADSAELIGKRVVGEINLACGHCDWCRKGLSRHCPSRTVLGIAGHPGAFREFLTLPEANLHVVPNSLTNETAVFVEPLAAACEILDQARIPEGADIAVLGPPDGQELYDEWGAYERLVEEHVPLPIDDLQDAPARLLSLDGQWFPCRVRHYGGRYVISEAAMGIRGGMSGSWAR